MRLAATSDLRYTPDRHDLLADFVAEIADTQPDALVVAGNLGETPPNFEAALRLFDQLDCPRLLVLGNRDLWSRFADAGSQQLWEETLPALIHRSDWIWLEQQNAIYDQVGICGTLGWYDYSARDTSLGFDLEQYRELKGLVNFDAQYINWAWRDQDFAGHLQRGFMERLERLEYDSTIDRIVVITHMPVFREAMIPDPNDMQWSFGMAYAFNLTLGRQIAPKRKVRHVISGHVSQGGVWSVHFGEKSLEAHILGYDEDDVPRLLLVDV